MRRLRMPASFVGLLWDSLTGLTSCVRWAYGVPQHFDVQRSLRQGCSLAPLLFVVLMDALQRTMGWTATRSQTSAVVWN
jgi:hypothetical protein